nr:hypothetical protein [Actinoplanes polyasparticus]
MSTPGEPFDRSLPADFGTRDPNFKPAFRNDLDEPQSEASDEDEREQADA